MTSVQERPPTKLAATPEPTITVPAAAPKKAPDIRYLVIMGREKVTWDANDESTWGNAQAVFNMSVAGGRVAFASDPSHPSVPAERIKDFDPTAKEILLAAQIVGG